jgi:hypothetical protein
MFHDACFLLGCVDAHGSMLAVAIFGSLSVTSQALNL